MHNTPNTFFASVRASSLAETKNGSHWTQENTFSQIKNIVNMHGVEFSVHSY